MIAFKWILILAYFLWQFPVPDCSREDFCLCSSNFSVKFSMSLLYPGGFWCSEWQESQVFPWPHVPGEERHLPVSDTQTHNPWAPPAAATCVLLGSGARSSPVAAAAALGAALWDLLDAELFWKHCCKWGSVSLCMAFSGCGQFLVHRSSTVLTWTLCAAESVHTCVSFLGLGFFLALLSYFSDFGLKQGPYCNNSSILQLIICFICFSNLLVFPFG